MLQCTLDGYNSTVFAYGQAGSGKSYSIMGEGSNKGHCKTVYGYHVDEDVVMCHLKKDANGYNLIYLAVTG
jgi:hypothetical protein